MSEDAFRTLRVSLATADAAAARRADRHRRREFASGAVTQPGELTHHLVERWIDVVGELDFRDWLEPVDAHANGRRDNAALGDRRVEHTMLAMLALEPVGDP